MRYSHIWADAAGESHVEWLEPSFEVVSDYTPGVPPVGVGAAREARQLHFLRFPAGWFGDWHPTPVRQFWVLLQGRLGLALSDGTQIDIASGDSGLIEDTRGRGHKTWVVGDEEAVLVMITLAEEV